MLSGLIDQKRVPDLLGQELPMTMSFHMGDENQMLVLWKNSQYPVKHWAISPDLFSCIYVQVFQVWKCALDLYGHQQGYYRKDNCVGKNIILTKWDCRRYSVVFCIRQMEAVATKFTKKICFKNFSYLNVRESRVYQLCRKLEILLREGRSSRNTKYFYMEASNREILKLCQIRSYN